MSTASSFVYGSAGETIDGASLVGGASVGGALPTAAPTVSTKPPKPLTTPLTNGPNAPLATHSTPIPSATTAAASPAWSGIGMPRRRSIRRWRERRAGDGGECRISVGTGRPSDAGRGRTCGGRPPRRDSIGADCRTAGPIATGAPDGPRVLPRWYAQRCVAAPRPGCRTPRGRSWRPETVGPCARPRGIADRGATDRSPGSSRARARRRSPSRRRRSSRRPVPAPPGTAWLHVLPADAGADARPVAPAPARDAAAAPRGAADAARADRVRAAEPPPQRLSALLHDGSARARSRSRRRTCSRACCGSRTTSPAASSAAACTSTRAT